MNSMFLRMEPGVAYHMESISTECEQLIEDGLVRIYNDDSGATFATLSWQGIDEKTANLSGRTLRGQND